MKEKRIKKFVINPMGILALLTILPLTGYAEVTKQINYQCCLAESKGAPLDITVPFSIFDVDAIGTNLWSETRRLAVTECVNVASDKDMDKSECISIREIWKDVSAYKDHWVIVCGEYQGWSGKGILHPMISRSDWGIRDQSSGIYFSGKRPDLDMIKDVGTSITVKGMVEVSNKGIPYIKAEEVSYH